ncbi:GLMN protein, partial [Polypterus senegalus]
MGRKKAKQSSIISGRAMLVMADAQEELGSGLTSPEKHPGTNDRSEVRAGNVIDNLFKITHFVPYMYLGDDHLEALREKGDLPEDNGMLLFEPESMEEDFRMSAAGGGHVINPVFSGKEEVRVPLFAPSFPKKRTRTFRRGRGRRAKHRSPRKKVIPEDGFKVEDYEIFQKAGKNCLEEMKTAEILDIIKEEKNKVCSPKEVLLGLLEQIEDADMDKIAETIVLLLQPLQTVLLKLGKKKPPSVGMSLSTILNQISQLPVPYTQEQEEDDAHGLCQCCVALLTFTKPFVEEVQQSYTNKMVGDMEELRNELLKFPHLEPFPVIQYVRHNVPPNIKSEPDMAVQYVTKIMEKVGAISGHGNHSRTKGLQIFQLYIDIFDVEGKYKLFRCLLEVSHHAGVEGYIIQNIKKQIDLALKPGNGNLWFSGAALLPLLRLVLFLPQGPETDLLQNLDRIMESLNLLRYLLIRDKEYDNQTGIWTELYKIEDNFLKPLHTGLNMSKAHYEAELKNTKENKKHKESKEENPLCTLSVAGEKLPNMTTEMQLQTTRDLAPPGRLYQGRTRKRGNILPGCKRAAPLISIKGHGYGAGKLNPVGVRGPTKGLPGWFLSPGRQHFYHTRKCCRPRNCEHPECFQVQGQHVHPTRKCCWKTITEHLEHDKRGRFTPFEELDLGGGRRSLRERSGGGQREKKTEDQCVSGWNQL